MKVLYITGSCLQCNTSANMSHNSFVQGLIENNCDVDIIMADPGLLKVDQNMPFWKEAKYFVYKSTPVLDKIGKLVKLIINPNKWYQSKRQSKNSINVPQIEARIDSIEESGNKIKSLMKFVYYNILTKDSPHFLSRKWLKEASNFKSDTDYDIVISNSSPASSHALANILLTDKKNLAKKWVQIWEDPWYYDLYFNQKKKMILDEEARLLNLADEIYYVSPLTLLYQKIHFPSSAKKMKCLPLPYLKSNSVKNLLENNELVFGYFGDYYSHVRNLKPFYEASVEINTCVNIYGDTNENFSVTDKIKISKRVDIGTINKIQNDTDVLIHLSNIKGGQIPGKIYHYSSSNKPIIFILDGNEEEKKLLKNYFGQFNRYYFCENNKESIKELMYKFQNGEIPKKSFVVEEFSPKNIGARLLEKSIG
jgi:hypothetical protein